LKPFPIKRDEAASSLYVADGYCNRWVIVMEKIASAFFLKAAFIYHSFTQEGVLSDLLEKTKAALRQDSMFNNHRTALFCFLSLGLFVAAPQVAAGQTINPVVIASGLVQPWGLAFLPDGKFIVTEKSGRIQVVDSNGKLNGAIQGVPEVLARGQGGMLDIITDSSFAQNRTVYFCYAEPASLLDPGSNANSTALASARLSLDNLRMEDVRVIFRQMPRVQSNLHFGCRIVEALKEGKPDGNLFLTLGDRFSRMQDAQTLDNHHGKIIRITKGGLVPSDNPFVNQAKAKPEIWSYGHRNLQGAALAADGTLWTHEHGPQGGDELNIGKAGKNYGWPVITFGKNYGVGTTIGEGTERADIEPAVKTWVPSIAPSGISILNSDKYGPGWKGNVFIGSLKFKYLSRIELDGGKFFRESRLLEDLGQRIRDVRQGPDGFLYVLTDERDGRLIRLQP
jgi:aldose sugar dehydrogenase